MDRVTRYPIFSNHHAARVTSLVQDENSSYTVKLVGVGPEARWSQDDLQTWSTEYQTRPEVKRTSVSSTRRVFLSQSSPRSLYLEDEDEEMKAYHLDTSDALCSQPRDLEAERWAVIHSQAIRKGGTVATLQEERRPAGQPQPMSTEEILVDTEQIDFLAARQQFLSLEKANTNPVTWSPTAKETFANIPPGVSQAPKASTRPHIANGYAIPAMSPAKEVTLEKKTVHVSPAGSIRAANDPGHWTRAESPETPKETPIEREIRLAQEREAELREQRGLGHAAGHQELVQIPSRPLLNKVSLTELPARRDRGRPSLYVQRDMVQETQREEDHRREGLQVGRASTPDWTSQDPQPRLQRSLSSDYILSPDARASDPAPEARKVNRIPPDAYQPYLGPGTPKLEFSAFGVYSKPNGVFTEDTKALAFQKAGGSPRHVSEYSVSSPSSKQAHLKSHEKSQHASVGIVQLENFHLRPLRFSVPDVPQQAETSHTWGWEVPGGPVLKLQKSPSSDLLEREVESVLQREREVAEERRNAFFPEVFSPVLDQDEQDSRSSSQASGITGSYSVSESPLFTPIQLHSSLVWKVQAPKDGASRQKTKKEMRYAGINPSDRVNSEVLGATRVTRHKNVLAERWEAGIYASEDED
ncbi:mitotic interactor and substrate of PLK1 [Phodopus roborovskii]|uniref:Misp protein n=1 Tax=Phodopus roborovskii TaxID=109678 RepID=A0AAU9YXG5_PHORO|nr:mitotic interactor and substrate of PLK1 [Phodopus roborovskii]CAH6779340.1 Misp [Phodopus roborovskii]